MPCNLYEVRQFQDFCENALRPGGLALTERALANAGFAKGSRLLDIGCGLGTTVAYLYEQGYSVFGIDISEPILARAKESHPHLDLRYCAAHELPWNDRYFDGVFCECTLSLAHDPAKVLLEIHRILAVHGKLVLSDFYSHGETVPQNVGGTCIARAKTREAFQDLLESCGFGLVLWRDATDSLRQFAARIVWEYGSMQRFWRELSPDGSFDGMETMKLGYALSIWQKKGTRHGG